LEYLDLLQWPAMLVTVIAAWLVAPQAKRRREAGFWMFLPSNALWNVWAWHDRAYALFALQLALPALNVRGAYKNEPEATATAGKTRRARLSMAPMMPSASGSASGSFKARRSDHARVQR